MKGKKLKFVPQSELVGRCSGKLRNKCGRNFICFGLDEHFVTLFGKHLCILISSGQLNYLSMIKKIGCKLLTKKPGESENDRSHFLSNVLWHKMMLV